MLKHQQAALVALIALIVLSGCRLVAPGAAEPAWPRTGDADSASIEATPAPTTPVGRHFGDVHDYRDGLEVRVCEIRRAVLGWFPATTEGAAAGDPYTIIRIQLDNHSGADFEAAFAGKLQYGPELKEAGTVTLDQSSDMPVIAPGGSAVYDFGFLIPDDSIDDVLFELSIDIEKHEHAYFTGSVRTS